MTINRRDSLKAFAVLGLAAFATGSYAFSPLKTSSNFSYCLNTSTINGPKLGIIHSIEIASKAGYNGVELWVRDIQKYLDEGNSPQELKKFLQNKNLIFESAIGFAPWMVSDDGMAQMKIEMQLMKSIGCKRIAAPAVGMPVDKEINWTDAGKRYHQLLEIGGEIGIQPLLEFWGAYPPFHQLSQALMVAANANHPNAKILADVYHLFRGNSGFDSLKLLSGNAIEVFHMNDYPGNIPREQQKDSDRIFPGNGVAPMKQILSDLKNMGGEKVLSLELFNTNYWQEDPLIIAKKGLDKMKKLVAEIS